VSKAVHTVYRKRIFATNTYKNLQFKEKVNGTLFFTDEHGNIFAEQLLLRHELAHPVIEVLPQDYRFWKRIIERK